MRRRVSVDGAYAVPRADLADDMRKLQVPRMRQELDWYDQEVAAGHHRPALAPACAPTEGGADIGDVVIIAMLAFFAAWVLWAMLS